MPTRNFILDKGKDASAAITKFRAVKYTGPETVGPITAIGDMVVGVEQFGVTAGEIAKGKGASIAIAGRTEMEVSEALVEGDEVAITATGLACKASTAASATRIIGVCDEASGTFAAGVRAGIALNLPGRLKP